MSPIFQVIYIFYICISIMFCETIQIIHRHLMYYISRNTHFLYTCISVVLGETIQIIRRHLMYIMHVVITLFYR